MPIARALHLLAGVATIVVSNAAHAQTGTVEQTPSASEQTSQSGGRVEEIIVTAQRREERLQDVPVAVTALKGEALGTLGIQSALDLKLASPSLNTTNSNGVFTASIRGVGSFNYAAGVESPVALYIDGVYLATAQASELGLSNIASVEVLKGPQGTLFGRNATGGVLQIATAEPTAAFTGKFNIGYGNYNNITGDAYFSGGLAEGLNADLAVSARTQLDGFGRNLTTGANIGAVDHDVVVRSKVVWEPAAGTKVTAIGSYWDGKDTLGTVVAYPGKYSGFVPGALNPDLGYDSATNINFGKSGWSVNGAVKIEHDFGNVRFLSTTAYRKSSYYLREDLDFRPENLARLDQTLVDRQFSQEVQLSSIGNGPFKWTIGGFYFNLDSGYYPIVVDLANVPGIGAKLSIDATHTTKFFAGYGQASYEIAPRTTLTLGGRYTYERRGEENASQVTEIPALGLTIPTSYPNRKITADRFTYRVSLDHRFSDAVMLYASVNSGFKSGGFNVNSPGEAPYRPESITAYEIGLKSDLLDRRLRLNVAGFYYDYSNIQVQRISTFALIIQNGPTAKIYGMDADVTAALSKNLSVTGGITWVSPKFGSFPGCPISSPAGGVPLAPGSCSDNQIPMAAKFTGTLATTYSADLGSGHLQASANLYYNSGYFFESDNVLKQNRFAKLNANVKWTASSGISIGIYARNLTNNRTAAFAANQASGNAVVIWDDPRTYGVTLGYKF